jgi:transposase
MHEQKSTAEEVEFLKAENARLHKIILLMKRDKFGSKSEKVIDIPGQLLFNEIEKEASQLLPPETEKITYTRKKGKGKKKPYPEGLPREERVIDLKDEEKFCPHDQAPLALVGEERREKLKTIPAQMSIVVEIIKKYACPGCESYMAQPKVNSVLPGTIATPELLSFIIFSKFFQSLPLYRLEELFNLKGVELSRGTMARWMIKIKDQLMPLYNLLQDKALESGYMAIDATHVQVLKEPGRKAETKSSMWARGSPELGIVLFDYDVSGGGKVAKNLMTGFTGALQADAHRGYDAIERKDMLLLGCMMHARRRFHKAWLVGGKKPGVAAQALSVFKFIYEKEDSYKAQGLSAERRKYFRDEELKPSLETFKVWIEEQLPKVPKSSELGNALRYYVNEYEELTAFLADGRFEIDNGWLERTIRKFAIGRNNWMFCDTVEGAHASSLLYSLVITAKLNGKDPYQAMTEIFYQLPHAKTVDDYEKLSELLLSPANPLSCHKKEG